MQKRKKRDDPEELKDFIEEDHLYSDDGDFGEEAK